MEQCRYCIYAMENDTRYTCRCSLSGEDVSLYGTCDEFDDDFRKVVNNADNRLHQGSGR